jgi:hypothetical protein
LRLKRGDAAIHRPFTRDGSVSPSFQARRIVRRPFEKESEMRSFAGLATALALGLSTIAATAMPFNADFGKGKSEMTQVRYGCGPNGMRGPGGHCRPRFNCPRGWHPGPYGWHCFRN